MNDVARVFGARLRSCRQSAGLSQQELAERSGLSVRAISDLERGRTRFPYQDSLARLADALALGEPTRTEFITSASRRLAPAEAGTVLRPLPPAPIEDLARAQHALPVHDPVELGGDIWESDDELTEFLADLRIIRTLALG
ncbi:MAG TPA: helix-turn-helix transcriptional regulator [Streptosporangiaceae bacterium]